MSNEVQNIDLLLQDAISTYRFGRPSKEQVDLILSQCKSLTVCNSRQQIDSFLKWRRSSILNCTMGVAVGDALGLGIENENGKRIEGMFVLNGMIMSTRSGKFAINYAPGYGSDDTEQHIAVMKCLVEYGPLFTATQLAQCFLNEYKRNRNSFDISTQGHGSIRPFLESEDQKDLEKAREEQRVRFANSGTCGNGILMRALPLSFIEDKTKRFSASKVNAKSTHPCAIAVLCSAVMVEVVHELKNETRISIFERANELTVQLFQKKYSDLVVKICDYFKQLNEIEWTFNDWTFSGVEPIPDEVRKLICKNDEGVKYDALTTLGAVFFGLKHAKSTKHLAAFCLKIGVDVDSVTAVALGIFGKIGLLSFDGGEGFGLSDFGLSDTYLESLKSFDEVIQVSSLFEDKFLFQEKKVFRISLNDHSVLQSIELRKWAQQNDVLIISETTRVNPMLYVSTNSEAMSQMKQEFDWLGSVHEEPDYELVVGRL